MAQLTVSVSEDGMSAFVHGAVLDKLSVEQALQRLTDDLTRAGVTQGILPEAVGAAARSLSEQLSTAPTLVAMGTLPAPARPAGATFDVPVHQETAFPADMLAADAGIKYYQAVEHVKAPFIVETGATVGRFTPGGDARAGIDVRGRAIVSKSPSEKIVTRLGNGLSRHEFTDKVVSLAKGMIVIRGDEARIVPVSMNGAFSVEVSEDGLEACVHLHGAGPGGRVASREAILSALKSLGIVPSSSLTDLDNALAAMARDPHRGASDIMVAAGTAPGEGQDGHIEYLVNLDFSHKPLIRDDGKADYHNVHLFEVVARGQKLAKLHPPTCGEPGTDVHGNAVEGRKGEPASIRLGKHVAQDPDDAAGTVSLVDGHAYLHRDTLEVEEVMRIKADVDFHTGDLKFVGDVVIDGDVRAGFSVKADGSVIVRGAVEDARIESRRNVLVYGGFVGSGKGLIRAGGDVVVSFVRNQTISARNNIMINGEAVDARLMAGNSVLIESARAWIVGGETVAKRAIRAFHIGNPPGNATRVTVGVDLVVKDAIARLDKDLEKLKAEYASLSTVLGELAAEAGAAGALDNERSLKRARASVLSGDLQTRLDSIVREKNRLLGELYFPEARIVVKGALHANVVVTIARSNLVVREEMERCCLLMGRTGVLLQELGTA